MKRETIAYYVAVLGTAVTLAAYLVFIAWMISKIIRAF